MISSRVSVSKTKYPSFKLCKYPSLPGARRYRKKSGRNLPILPDGCEDPPDLPGKEQQLLNQYRLYSFQTMGVDVEICSQYFDSHSLRFNEKWLLGLEATSKYASPFRDILSVRFRKCNRIFQFRIGIQPCFGAVSRTT